MGVFSAKSSPNMDAKRNSFPLSFSNNLTMQFGKIYPVFVKSCDPGDSFNIKASFGLNFLPTVYPVQTPMKAYLHFFYCRNRTVWTDFMNFYTMKDRAGQNIATSTYVPPYLDFSKQKIGASELADYMGIPTLDSSSSVPLARTTISNYSIPLVSNDYVQSSATAVGYDGAFPMYMDRGIQKSAPQSASMRIRTLSFPVSVSGSWFEGKTIDTLMSNLAINPEARLSFSMDVSLLASETSTAASAGFTQAVVSAANSSLQQASIDKVVIAFYSSVGNNLGYVTLTDIQSFISNIQYDGSSSPISFVCSFSGLATFTETSTSSDHTISFVSLPAFTARPSSVSVDTPLSPYDLFIQNLYLDTVFNSSLAPNSSTYTSAPIVHSSLRFSAPLVNSYSLQWVASDSSESVLSNPFYDSVNNPNGLKINSLPFRHYEAIYNYFYRDNRNNPLRNSEGLPVYNEVLLPSQLTGGVETGSYDFHYRNWEQDFLTTCVQEPQLGQAPLVGISSTGVASFKNDDGTTTNVQLRVAADGDTIEGFDTSEGVSAPVAHSLVELATQGISISDFRNVNAFQTWLEVQMRKTLRFGDSIQGHFNVNPKYDDYLYPEFIGGVTQDVDTYQVNQTSPSDDSPLGAYAGQAICKGSVPRAISKFCDEPGYIIGLLSLVPQPVYSQILPKHYLRRETLDYHFPEFNNISYQPVTYAEVCPVLAFNENKSLDSVFGYQRPWYDLISSLDEAHGQFLTTLNGFILSRRFGSYPSLGERFLTVHPEDLNDIFSTKMTDSNDVILGQLYFDVVKKTQISKFGIPSLQIG